MRQCLCAVVCRAVFAFSTELLKAGGCSGHTEPSSSTCSSSTCSEKTYILQPTGRYAHSPAYIRQAAQQSGWEVVMVKEAQIRQNAGQPIWGSLCLLQRVCNKQ
jgi:predicted TPR repeat methyltransferase